MTAQTRKMLENNNRRKKLLELESRILRIEEKINRLEKKRKDIWKRKETLISIAFTNGYVYCKSCRKLYLIGQCRLRLEFRDGDLDALPAKCPKGHEWDRRDQLKN